MINDLNLKVGDKVIQLKNNDRGSQICYIVGFEPCSNKEIIIWHKHIDGEGPNALPIATDEKISEFFELIEKKVVKQFPIVKFINNITERSKNGALIS